MIAEATAQAVRTVADRINAPGGMNAAKLEVAEQYIQAFARLARTDNTLFVPSNLADVASIVGSTMTVLDRKKRAEG